MSGNGEPESTDSLKQFGAVLKAFRERAEMTQEALARRVQFSPATVASIEQGRRLPPPRFIERAEEVLDAFGALKASARYLARHPGLAAWFRQWAQLEERAISLDTYECRMIPGLLQTEAYARTLFGEPACHLWTTSRSRPRSPPVWNGRSYCGTRPNTTFSFILEEHSSCGSTGGVSVTRELVEHVLECSRSCGTWKSRSCRWSKRSTPGWTVPCSSWRPRRTVVRLLRRPAQRPSDL